jgi:hypothetical protein
MAWISWSRVGSFDHDVTAVPARQAAGRTKAEAADPLLAGVAGGRAAPARLGLFLVTLGRVWVRRPILLGVLGDQRLGDVLELLPLGLDPEQQLGYAARIEKISDAVRTPSRGC